MNPLWLLMLVLTCACSARGQQLAQSPSPTVSRSFEPSVLQRSVPLIIRKSAIASPTPRHLEPKWSAQIPTLNGEAVLLFTGNVYVASGGPDARAFNSSTGKLLWLRHDVGPPLYLYRGLLFGYDHRNGKIASVDAQTGVTRWSHSYCNHRAPNFMYGGTRNLIIGCSVVTPSRDERWNVGVSYLSGSIIYRRSFKPFGTIYERPQRITEDIVGVSGGFNGAWMGSTLDFLDAFTGKQIFTATDVSIAGIRNGIVMLNDLCCFDRLGVYEPARIELVNAKSGKMTGPWSLTPDSDRNVDHGNAYDFGRAQLIDNWLYLTVGPILYRYRLTSDLHPDVTHPELVVADLQSDPIFIGRHIVISTGKYRPELITPGPRMFNPGEIPPEFPPSTTWLMDISEKRGTLKPLARGRPSMPAGSQSTSPVYENGSVAVLQDDRMRPLFLTESATLYRPNPTCPGIFAGASHQLAVLCSQVSSKKQATQATVYGYVLR